MKKEYMETLTLVDTNKKVDIPRSVYLNSKLEAIDSTDAWDKLTTSKFEELDKRECLGLLLELCKDLDIETEYSFSEEEIEYFQENDISRNNWLDYINDQEKEQFYPEKLYNKCEKSIQNYMQNHIYNPKILMKEERKHSYEDLDI